VINFEDFPLRRKDSGHSWFQLTDENQREQLRGGIVAPDYPGPVAADWPDLLQIVSDRVQGTRASHSTAPWWQFERPRIELKAATKTLPRVLACSRIGNAFAFVFLPTGVVFNEKTVIFATDGFFLFAATQSRVHETWARFFSSTLKDDLQYTPSDCFETFPFPNACQNNPSLESAGQAYHSLRGDVMVRNNEGLT
jgi:hypothetical protein